MDSSILSYILTGYAIYSAIANKNKLQQQLDRIIDIENNQEELTGQVEELTTKTYNLLDQSLVVNYTLVCGRPTSMNKLSASLHFSVTNTSQTNSYIIKAIMFTPIIGTTICNGSSQKLFNEYWRSGYRLSPGQAYSGRMSYNNLNLPPDVYQRVSDYLSEQFRLAEGWNKLGDRYATISGGCMSDVWLVANAPYIDGAHDYVVSRREVEGDISWHGGNYLPGNSKPEVGQVLSFNAAKEMFRL